MGYYKATRYIEDGIFYRSWVFDSNGTHVNVSTLWEQFNKTRPIGNHRNNTVTHVTSYDNGYTSSKILSVNNTGRKDLLKFRTRDGRTIHAGYNNEFMTDQGMVKAVNLGIGAKLKFVDTYKYYHGDTIKVDTSGLGRMKALLRTNHIPFESAPSGGIETEKGILFCMEWDTDYPAVHGNKITYGLNNYRESMKELFDLPDYHYDELRAVREYGDGHLVAVHLEGVQNFVLQNGLIIGAPKESMRDGD